MPRGKATQGLIPLNQRTPEERRRIGAMGAAKREANKREKMTLQKCMRTLLELDVNSKKKREILESFGLHDEQINNKALLMVALFQKGVKGDVQATKEIINMMDKLDMFEDTGKLQQVVNINLVSCGDDFEMSEEQLKEVEQIESEC